MTDRSPPTERQTYRIGAVSRLTGIPADTLRVWERRYHVATPVRSEAGTRLYDSEDIGRLTLIKRLVDRGDAISSVANLSLDALRERMRGAELAGRAPVVRSRPLRLLVYGPYLGERLRADLAATEDFECLGFHSSREGILSNDWDPAPDVLVLEYPALHSDQVGEVHRLLARSGAAHCVLVYGFAGQGVVEQVVSEHLSACRAPIGLADLRHCCQGLRSQPSPQRHSLEQLGIDLVRPAPSPRYSAEELAAIAGSRRSSCDCYRHLADLIAGLSAFESYARGCELRGAEVDASHALVHAGVVQARAVLEAVLERSLGQADGDGCDMSPKD
ncbi:MerR family transcriptional regulator [Imhoffiella purpurea]|uniref:MerR family transcriptional regulator n=1 Tax=Imhoffiella purpurea TaxID=1249627 RepID=UPI0005C1B098|nr:MerR family transcriptional regulator [Imhoffiella purpurea]